MILVLASAVNEDARTFASELSSVTAASVLTCRDLAEEPSDFRYPDFQASSLTVRGRKIAVQEIEGLVNLLPVVLPDELFFYPPEEREYQAAEFHALLTFFLSALACPVVNRPSPQSLNGPCSSAIAWRCFAKREGLAVAPIKLDTDDTRHFFDARRPEQIIEVSCLGGRLIDSSGTDADWTTVELARKAKVEYLRAVFEDCGESPRLLTASGIPDVRNAATRRALAGYFGRLRGCA
ncbi:MAG TPA: hypothetical protein VH640_28725 [Bryobacteraceae bacterium]|jgi:hypothetical protein